MVNGMQYHTRVPNRLQGYDYSQNGASGKIRGHAQPCAFAAFDPGRGVRIARPYGFQHRPTIKELRNQTLHHPIWQKSFHDHVIRTQTDYETIWLYIDSNPQTWQTDCLNPNRNKPQQSDTRKDVTL